MGEADATEENLIWKEEMLSAYDSLLSSRKILYQALSAMPPRDVQTNDQEQMYVAGVILLKSIDAFFLWYGRQKG